LLKEWRSGILSYGCAVTAVGLALLLTQLIRPLIEPSIFPLFFAAVMVSAWYGGLGPGVLATILTVFIIDYFYIPRFYSFTVDWSSLVRLGVFLLVAILITSLTAARKRAAEVLRGSEERFRAVTESANDAIISATSGGKIIEWNKGAQAIFGYSKEEALGQSLVSLMPERFRDGHQKGLDRFQSTAEPRLIGKTVELQGLRKDGSEFPLELSLATWQIRKNRYFTGFIRDITKRKQAEDSIRRLNAELEGRVVERTTQLEGTIKDLQREMAEHKRAVKEKEELLHDLTERNKELTILHKTARLLQDEQKPTPELLQDIVMILPTAWQYPELAAARVAFDGVEYKTLGFSPSSLTQRVDFTTSSGKHGLVEIVYLRETPNGAKNPFLPEEKSLLDSLTEMLRLHVERKEAKEQTDQVTRELIQRNQDLLDLEQEMRRVEPLAALGWMTGAIAHELGTPLNSVLGYTQLLAEEELTENARDDLKTIETQIRRMTNIVQYYLDRTRASPRDFSQVNLNELIRDTLLLVKPNFEQKGIEVTLLLTEPLPALSAHAASLQRVLINLLNNALDAMQEGEKVTIATRDGVSSEHAKPGMIVEVKDTGEGIVPDFLPKIFDPFVTTKEPKTGTGLGLVVCQEIIKRHGGTIRITSQVGAGTCVTIFFPIHEAMSQSISAEKK
jgi:PAS domain S-box-containing protein